MTLDNGIVAFRLHAYTRMELRRQFHPTMNQTSPKASEELKSWTIVGDAPKEETRDVRFSVPSIPIERLITGESRIIRPN